MTVFGHPVLFICLENREATASEKTPMQWHTTQTLSIDNALLRTKQSLCLLFHLVDQLADLDQLGTGRLL